MMRSKRLKSMIVSCGFLACTLLPMAQVYLQPIATQNGIIRNAGVECVPAQRAAFDRLDAYIARAREDWNIPGLAVAVVKEGEIIFSGGYGVRELGGNEPVDEHTSFAVASNTKAFTCTLLAMLVEEKQIGWDDRVIDYLPDFQMFDPYVTRDIRVRDLVTHRSGLPTFGGDRLWIGNDLGRDEIIRRIRYIEPTAPFRSRYQYQNLMYLVAGRIIRAVTGEKWEDAVQNRLLDPLGMEETTTSVTRLKSENVAVPHEIVQGVLTPIEYDNVDGVAPAAAVNSSVSDMTRWMRLHLGKGQFEEKRILRPETVRELHSVQFPLRVSSFAREQFGTEFSGYGLGWVLSEYRGKKTVSHGGGLSGMISLQTLVPELDLGVIILTNFAPNNLTSALTYRILDLFMGAEETDWSDRFLNNQREADKRRAQAEETLRKARVRGTKPSKSLDDYTGIYTESVTGPVRIIKADGKLVFDYNPRYIGDLEHWHFDTFRVTWRHPIFDMESKSFITFRLDNQGNVEGFTVRFYYDVDFERVRDRE